MKEAVIFGAGNVGRGFIGQLYSESGYRVTFVDVDQPLLDALNARGAYTIRLVTDEQVEEVQVAPVRALHASNVAEVADAVAHAEIGATAVGANVLKHISPNVAAGVKRRAELSVTTPLNLIICENLKNAAAQFRAMIKNALDVSYHAYFDQHVGLVDTVIARMVPIMPGEIRAFDPSLIIVEPYKELPVDRTAFVGAIPAIVGMIPYAPFSFYTERKLYVHNAGHAVLGYLGYLAGYEYGYQALADAAIYARVHSAMRESQRALEKKYNLASGALDENVADLLQRFRSRALGDTIFRLARDPLRKLAHDDRLIGAALNALGQGIPPENLVSGIVAALAFHHPADPAAQDLQSRLAREGLMKVLEEVCGLKPDEPLTKMIVEQYRAVEEKRTL
jgi:mannitol-1-phosphate 5-dehydrogenase